ncbi:3-oxoacyl-ACP synthase III family protein [Actinoplanes sp. N902-109]|uniref:3-oxoacyl-ACP synthase III family protein n=1 Tax=Actinoplanes sp. (strain N902-109) TaxID=649831 RepID=UPI00059FC306|nr:ketoacyl-ACP synthase III [Actinoplanes sp. N902-109]
MQSIPRTGILGTGAYVPEHEVTNEELVQRVTDTTPEWIAGKTLIEARRFAAPHEATSDLATAAARAALEDAGIAAARVDYLIVSTSTGDSPQPPTASLVQHALGAGRAACFDINVVCAGFVFGLALAQSLIAVRPDAVVLVVAADVYSRILDFDDRRTAILFGDGAGAAVLGAVPEPYGLIDSELITRGDAHELIHVKAGGSRLPASAQTVADGDHYFRMNGRGVRDFVVAGVPPVLAGLLGRAGITPGQVDHFVPHQANGMMIRELVTAAGLTSARTHLVLDRLGNTGSASAAIALDQAARDGEIKDGDLVLLAGFGGGMSVGAAVLRWYGKS